MVVSETQGIKVIFLTFMITIYYKNQNSPILEKAN